MRLPNGYGTVYKLSGKRRNPYIVRKTIGWSDKGKQLLETIGYAPTKKAGLEMLADYNANPYDLTGRKFTLADIYEKWSQEKFDTISRSTQTSYKAAWNYLSEIADKNILELRAANLQKAVDDCPNGYSTKKNIKVLLGQLYEYALKNDIIQKDYSAFIKLPENVVEEKIPFSKTEINTLWQNVDRFPDIETVLILLYTGMRVGEMLQIKTENVNLEERYMRGGLKTKAGKNRVIPIHDKIYHLIEKRYDPQNTYLIKGKKDKQLSYSAYRESHFDVVMQQFNMKHRPHDCRHTFISLADSAGMPPTVLRRIVGHAGKDITDKVYTHKEIQELIDGMNMIKI